MRTFNRLPLTNTQRAHNLFMDIISSHFRNHPELGRIKTISRMSPWGYGDRYHVKCTLQREYIVYEKDGEIHNIGLYKQDLI